MQEKAGAPAIRFAGFAGDWEQHKLSKITTMHARIGWQNLRTSEFLDSGDYMLITGTDFEDGVINYDTCHYVARERYEQDKHIQVSNGSILITKDGTLGKVAYIQGLSIPATLNAGVFNVEIKNKNEVDNKYLYQYLKAPFLMDYVDKKATGGTIKHLNQNILVDFPVNMPVKAEQQAIGQFFEHLDHLIILHQNKYSQLCNVKKSMLEKMFPKEGTTVPEIRFAAFTGDWEQCKAKELCSISTGKSNTQDRVDEGIYPFYVRSPIVERSNRYLFDEEAVLTVGDGVGTGKVFHYVNGKYDLHQRVYRMFDFSDGITAKYFYYYFSNHFFNRVMSMTAKTSVDSVRYEMIAEMEIALPKVQEQKAISAFFDSLDNLITLHQHKLDRLQNIRKACLEKMFI
ncbi:MAG: restriction endonuclease subunit S [Lachnospiraceae bacterium]|nr:restriction endonuclease subunit S [Lachnospiraceae bacterium]